MELAALARSKGLVNQVGYHFRHVEAFREAHRLLQAGALGQLTMYAPRPTMGLWWSQQRDRLGARASRKGAGVCTTMRLTRSIWSICWLVLRSRSVARTQQDFSREVEDEVYASLHFANGLSGQLAANWSDESFRKMSTKITIWGANGRLAIDRQEVPDLPAGAGERRGHTASGAGTRFDTRPI